MSQFGGMKMQGIEKARNRLHIYLFCRNWKMKNFKRLVAKFDFSNF